MADTANTHGQDNLPKDYPGRMVEFPPQVTHLVFAMFGVH